jgi:iron(III) transport system substrate-binding protein
MKLDIRPLAVLALAALAISTSPILAQSGEVNIYSYREPGLIQPLLDQFTAETGIKTNVLFAGNGLIERAAAEGELSPVDVVLTVNIGNLTNAKALGISQPISPEIIAKVPGAYRDPDGHWTALSMRVRVFYASNDRVSEETLDYDDIAGPEWKGRLCTRSGQHVYNIGLIASRIDHWGLDKTREWLRAVRDNLSRKPTGNDRAQAEAIFSGECDLAIGNTYYMGLMINNTEQPEQQDWAAAARIIYPDGDGIGTHVNVSGAVLAAHAPNKENAEKLIAFLLSDEAQHLYAETNYEFPILPGVAPSDLVASWGELHADPTSLTEIAALQDEASALVDELQFDGGPQN